MKKILWISVLSLLLSGNAYGKVFTWTCLRMPAKDFQLVFEINDVRKTIKHLTSYNFSTKNKFDVNKYDNVIKFEKDFAWSSYDFGDIGIRYNDFKNNKIFQSKIFPNNPEEYIYQNSDFDCFISN